MSLLISGAKKCFKHNTLYAWKCSRYFCFLIFNFFPKHTEICYKQTFKILCFLFAPVDGLIDTANLVVTFHYSLNLHHKIWSCSFATTMNKHTAYLHNIYPHLVKFINKKGYCSWERSNFTTHFRCFLSHCQNA